MFRGLRRFTVRLSSDERGYVMAFFALVLVPSLGITALVVDVTRQQTMHTQLQSIVDAAALAGAQQLDGTALAISNATDAVNSYLLTDPAFTEEKFETPEILFFRDEGCVTPVSTASPELAECVQVTSGLHTLGAIFAQVVGVMDDFQVRASATAEIRSVACAVQPLMWCSPWGSDLNLVRGQMVKLKQKSGGGEFPAGAFGLLDPPGVSTSGGPAQAIHLAQEDPPQCYTNEQSVRTGNVGGQVQAGIDARFGLYPASSTNELQSVPQSPNAIKGMTLGTNGNPNACRANSYTEVPDGRLPRDACFPDCPAVDPDGDVRLGDGNWATAAATYWNYHHSGPMPEGLGDPSSPNYLTRFDVFLREIGCTTADGCVPGVPLAGYEFHEPAPESVEPLCGKPIGGAERRVIYVSVLDCANANQVTGGGGTQVTIRRGKLASFFLTERATVGGEIHAEFINAVDASNDVDSKLRNIVQLVRQFRISPGA